MNAPLKMLAIGLTLCVTTVYTTIPCNAQINPTPADATRQKVAVVLSGGGAKGMAHIGALKVLEQAGIHIDYVVGTSMGAILGGLYSIGYTPNQLDSLVRTQDWDWLLSDKPKPVNLTLAEVDDQRRFLLSRPISLEKGTLGVGDGFIIGKNINRLFSKLTLGYHNNINFLTLPKPFTCVATNITTGNEVIIDQGVLPDAMRASMAIPGVFSPVRVDSMVLVDGGLVNNFPTDIARDMGADIVIGVDVQTEFSKNDTLPNLPVIAGRIVDIACRNKFAENLALTDIYIKVNVKGYSSASFNHPAIDTLIQRGYTAAMQQIDQIDSLAKKLTQKSDPQRLGWDNKQKFFISQIHFECDTKLDEAKLLKKCGISNNSLIDEADIEHAQDRLFNKFRFEDVNYRLQRLPDKTYRLTFMVEKSSDAKINLGIRFDSEEVVSLLLKGNLKLFSGAPELSFAGRLGRQYMGNLRYILNASPLSNFALSYTYWYREINVLHHGERYFNVMYQFHNIEMGYSNMSFNNLRIRTGFGLEYYHDFDILQRTAKPFAPDAEKHYHLLKYMLRADYVKQDRMFFPDRSFSCNLRATLYTDNGFKYRNHQPFFEISTLFNWSFPLSKRFTYESTITARIINGTDIPFFYANTLGSETPGRYFPQQLPFTGISRVEMVDDAIIAGYAKLRLRLAEKHYITAIANVAFNNSSPKNVFKGEFIWGTGLCYSYNTMFGPAEITFGYSNRTEWLAAFLNLGFYF